MSDETKALARTTHTLAEIQTMAQTAARCGLFPAIKTPEAAACLMLLCQAEGLHPITALRRYHIIQGTPALRTDAMLGDFMARGGKVEWTRADHEVCEAVFSSPGLSKPVTVRWSLDDAKRAGLVGKDNWQKYTRQMLRARVVSEGVRMADPSVVAGVYSPEEVADFDPPRNGNGVTYTPPPATASPEAPVVPPNHVEGSRSQAAPTAPPGISLPMATATAPILRQATAADADKTFSPDAPTTKQLAALNAALDAAGICVKGDTTASKNKKLGWLSREVKRDITSGKDLTRAEASSLIDLLHEAAREDAAPDAEVTT